MKGNCRIPSIFTVCFSHWVAFGYLEVFIVKQSRYRPTVAQRVPRFIENVTGWW